MASTITAKIAPLPRGDYSSSATYDKLDVVAYNGATYMAIKSVPIGTAPTNTTYWQLLVSGDVADGTVTTVKLANGAVTDAKLAQSGGVLSEVQQLNDIINLDNSIAVPFTDGGSGYVAYANGNITSSTTSSHTDYVDVSRYSKIFYKRVNTTTANPATGTAFYDADKVYISGIQSNKGQSANGYQSSLYEVIVPDNAVYARFTFWTNTSTYGNLEIKGEAKFVSTITSFTVEESADWIQGYYGASQGAINVTVTTALCTPHALGANVTKVYCDTNYKMRLQAFEGITYKGIWNGSTFVTSNPSYFLTNIDIASFYKSYPNYSFVLGLFRADNGNILLTEGSNVKFVYLADYYEEREYKKGSRNYYGINIAPRKHGLRYNLVDQTLPSPPSGTTSRQGMDIYDGKLFILSSNDKLTIVDKSTMSRIVDLNITCAHGNSCQFANTIETGETYPRLYCFGYTDNKVYVNAVSDNVTTLITTYTLPITGYRLSGGYDADRNLLKTIHYKLNSSTSRTGNGCVLSVWDLNDVTDNGDSTFTPALVSESEVPFVGVIQDCKCYGGWLYVLSGGGTNTPPYEATILTVYDDVCQLNRVILVGTGAEPEGLAFVENNYGVQLCTASNKFRFYEFTD